MDQPTSKEPRGPVSLRIKFRSASLDQFIERYAVDVSRGGIFIRTREPLPVGTQLRFDFQLQDAAPLLAGEGTIVWIRENDPARAGVTPGMGVRFDKLTTASQPVLEKILAEKARREQAGAPAKTGPAGGMAVRRPSSTFSALDPAQRSSALPAAARAAAAGPPRIGGLSPLGGLPRPPAPPTSSGPVGSQPRPTAPTIGSDLFGTRPAAAAASPSAIPASVPSESSGAFGRPRSTTGMNAQRPAPAPSALFEKPTADDIDRALAVLTEVEGPAPVPVPVPVDFSSRVRRPTDAQPMVVEAMPDVGSAPKPAHHRPTDAQPMVLASSPDLGDAVPRRPGTQPFFSGPNPATGETRAATVPVAPLGDRADEPLHDEEEDDDSTSAWVGSGPTRVGEEEIPAAARRSGTGPAGVKVGEEQTLVANLGEGELKDAIAEAKLGRLGPPALPSASAPPPLPSPSLAEPAPRSTSAMAPATSAMAPAKSAMAPAKSSMAPVAPTAPPVIMAPDFATDVATKKGSGSTFAILAVVLVLVAGAAGGGYYFLKGQGKGLVSKSAPPPAAESTTPAPEGTTPAPGAAAPSEPEKAAPAENEKPAGAGTAKPTGELARPEGEASKEAEAKPAEKPEAKPAEAKAAEGNAGEAKPEGKPHRGKRHAGGGTEAAAPAAEAAPVVADVSPKPTEAAKPPGKPTEVAKPPGEAPKTGDAPATAPAEAKPAGGGHVLKITSSPPGAEVIVDGTSMGTTPFSSGDIDPALPHSVTIKKDGFEAYEHMIGGSDWPRAKNGVRTLKLNAKLRSTGGDEGAKPAESDTPAAEPPPGLGTKPASPKRE